MSDAPCSLVEFQRRFPDDAARALGQMARRQDRSVLYKRLSRLFAELQLGRGDGRHRRLFRAPTRADPLILDDWGPDRLGPDERRELLKIFADRDDNASTLITSQLPVSAWHEVIGEATFADAILDRIVHNAYRLELDGESLRKRQAPYSAAALA